MNRILTNDNEQDLALLRRVTKAVKNPQATDVVIAIQNMKRALLEWENIHGQLTEGLAAPQIGVSLRIVILRRTDTMPPRDPRTVPNSATIWSTEDSFSAACRERDDWSKQYGSTYDPFHVLINPRTIVEEGSQLSVESCLSVPGFAYEVKRPTFIGFLFTNPNGKRSGRLSVKDHSATALRHELDHLDGILLPDIAIKTMPIGDTHAM